MHIRSIIHCVISWHFFVSSIIDCAILLSKLLLLSIVAETCLQLTNSCLCVVVVRETLETRGVLGQLRARIRAEVFSALDDPTDVVPEISRENMIINELIRDYLEYNHYKYSSSVFASGMLSNVVVVYLNVVLMLNDQYVFIWKEITLLLEGPFCC